MIDVRLLRNEPHVVKAALGRRGKPELLVQLDTAISLDEQVRDITARRDTIRARVNELSKLVGTARRNRPQISTTLGLITIDRLAGEFLRLKVDE